MATGIIALLNPLAQIQKAQDAKRKSDLSQIQKAVETYYQDVGKYPASSVGALPYRIIRLGNTIADWGQEFQPYMSILPKDPSSSKKYVYYSPSISNGQTYYIYASLDRGANDPQACKNQWCQSLAQDINLITACDPPDGPCDYGVSSPNVSP